MRVSPNNICNRALRHLGDTTVLSDYLTQTTERATAFQTFYEVARLEILREHDWGFASKIANTVLVEQNPNSGLEWIASYEYPTDCARIRRFLSGSRTDSIGSKIRYRIVNGTGLATATAITAATRANPGLITSAGHGLLLGDTGYIVSVAGMTELNSLNWVVIPVSSSTFYLKNPSTGYLQNTSAYTAYTSGGTIAKRISSRVIWTDAEYNATTPMQIEYSVVLSETDTSNPPDYPDDYINALSFRLAYYVCPIVV